MTFPTSVHNISCIHVSPMGFFFVRQPCKHTCVVCNFWNRTVFQTSLPFLWQTMCFPDYPSKWLCEDNPHVNMRRRRTIISRGERFTCGAVTDNDIVAGNIDVARGSDFKSPSVASKSLEPTRRAEFAEMFSPSVPATRETFLKTETPTKRRRLRADDIRPRKSITVNGQVSGYRLSHAHTLHTAPDWLRCCLFCRCDKSTFPTFSRNV